jgi:3-oxoacyl-[acyl-carrier protein] reductase
VNNAFIQYEPWINVLEQPLADHESQFRFSVLQNVLMAKAFVPDMIRNHYGGFLAFSTECVMRGLPEQSAYVAGKRCMDGMLRVLAKEIGPYQITVNQVAPGWTITEQVRNEGTARQDAYEVTVPLKRWGEDHEVARVVGFLASDLVTYITGAYIAVCGAMLTAWFMAHATSAASIRSGFRRASGWNGWPATTGRTTATVETKAW